MTTFRCTLALIDHSIVSFLCTVDAACKYFFLRYWRRPVCHVLVFRQVKHSITDPHASVHPPAVLAESRPACVSAGSCYVAARVDPEVFSFCTRAGSTSPRKCIEYMSRATLGTYLIQSRHTSWRIFRPLGRGLSISLHVGRVCRSMSRRKSRRV